MIPFLEAIPQSVMNPTSVATESTPPVRTTASTDPTSASGMFRRIWSATVQDRKCE